MDINEDDTDQHTCTIAATFPPNTVLLVLKSTRVSGTGSLHAYPNGGTNFHNTSDNGCLTAVTMPNLVYAQTVGNDDFDLFCLGYFVKGPVEHKGL